MTKPKRGRKSAASMQVAGLNLTVTAERLNAPVHLADAESAVWQQLVDDQPPEAFSRVHGPLIELYARHITQARLLAEDLRAFEPAWMATPGGLDRYERLLKMAEREGRAASSLATRLRITRQAVEHRTTAGRKVANHSRHRKPWEAAP